MYAPVKHSHAFFLFGLRNGPMLGDGVGDVAQHHIRHYQINISLRYVTSCGYWQRSSSVVVSVGNLVGCGLYF